MQFKVSNRKQGYEEKPKIVTGPIRVPPHPIMQNVFQAMLLEVFGSCVGNLEKHPCYTKIQYRLKFLLEFGNWDLASQAVDHLC